ncbi:MAG: transglutaminaseTgpA domain-containing protein [Thiomonas sp.]
MNARVAAHRLGRWMRRAGELPRDARDTLFLLAVSLLLMLPLLLVLPAWTGVLVLALLGWRALLAWRGAPLPRRTLLVAVLLGAIALTLWSFQTVIGRDAGVTLLCVLLGLKALETRSRRDTYVLFFLGFFTIAANFLFSQSLGTALLMLLATWGMLAALINANLPAGRPPLKQLLATALRMMALGTPAMILLFVVFPRFSAPLWALPQGSTQAVSGLSASMSPGQIAQLARDDSVVFRVVFDGPRPPDRLLYWRGPVLSRFDDGVWRADPRQRDHASPTPPPDLRLTAPAVRYTITLQPTQQTFVFALDAPAAAPKIDGYAVHWLPDLQLVVGRPLDHLVRYTAESSPQFRYGPAHMNAALRADEALPAGFDPRSVALGHELAAQARAAGQGGTFVAQALLRMFRTEPFRYTLDPGTYGLRDGVDEFLFDRRAGFCEHYAQAFVVVMRAAGIPARIVTGYQGGRYNPVDGTWVVRQSDAHAWAEYWLPGQGWVRADPTAAVDPARVDRSGATLAAREPLLGLAALGPRDTALLLQLRNRWDALNNAWNQWVLNYGSQRQHDLLRKLGVHQPDTATLAALAIGALLAATAVLGALLAAERRRADPWQRVYAQLRHKLQRAGIDCSAATAPRQLAARLRDGRAPATLPPGAAQAAAELLLRLEHWRYAPVGPAGQHRAEWAALRRAVRAWRP